MDVLQEEDEEAMEGQQLEPSTSEDRINVPVFKKCPPVVKPLQIKYGFSFTDAWEVNADTIRNNLTRPIALTSPVRCVFNDLISYQIALVVNEEPYADVLPTNPYLYAFFRMPICNVPEGVILKITISYRELDAEDANYIPLTFQWHFKEGKLTSPSFPFIPRSYFNADSPFDVGDTVTVYFECVMLLPRGINEPNTQQTNVEADFAEKQMHYFPCDNRDTPCETDGLTDVIVAVAREVRIIRAHAKMLPEKAANAISDGIVTTHGIDFDELLIVFRYLYYKFVPIVEHITPNLISFSSKWKMEHFSYILNQIRQTRVIRRIAKRMEINTNEETVSADIVAHIGLERATELLHKLQDFEDKYKFDPPSNIAYKKLLFFKAASDLEQKISNNKIPLTKDPYAAWSMSRSSSSDAGTSSSSSSGGSDRRRGQKFKISKSDDALLRAAEMADIVDAVINRRRLEYLNLSSSSTLLAGITVPNLAPRRSSVPIPSVELDGADISPNKVVVNITDEPGDSTSDDSTENYLAFEDSSTVSSASFAHASLGYAWPEPNVHGSSAAPIFQKPEESYSEGPMES